MKPKDLKLINYNSMVEVFHSESDRGAAVLAGSYTENVLGKYLAYKTIDKCSEKELFGSNGPLSTFSQRILISEAFGLVSKNTAETLHYIRKVRNYFAHHPLDASFDSSPVREWIGILRGLIELRGDQEEVRSELSNRNVYLLCCGYFSASTHVKMGDRGNYE
ncbi:hypothetical protein ACT3TC_02040 [Halomonas sp. AOP27-A1-41]|uniref:hypothetical protein n=1 Tax=Halomonas sp. AOP27-A1-41 TaxID=3457707 RepID=UPI0040338722